MVNLCMWTTHEREMGMEFRSCDLGAMTLTKWESCRCSCPQGIDASVVSLCLWTSHEELTWMGMEFWFCDL